MPNVNVCPGTAKRTGPRSVFMAGHDVRDVSLGYQDPGTWPRSSLDALSPREVYQHVGTVGLRLKNDVVASQATRDWMQGTSKQRMSSVELALKLSDQGFGL